jgi:hypothetical protein
MISKEVIDVHGGGDDGGGGGYPWWMFWWCDSGCPWWLFWLCWLEGLTGGISVAPPPVPSILPDGAGPDDTACSKLEKCFDCGGPNTSGLCSSGVETNCKNTLFLTLGNVAVFNSLG